MLRKKETSRIGSAVSCTHSLAPHSRLWKTLSKVWLQVVIYYNTLHFLCESLKNVQGLYITLMEWFYVYAHLRWNIEQSESHE